MNKLFPLAVLVLTLAVFQGCAKKADPNKPIDQIQQEVQAMSKSDLEGNAKAYVNEITARKSELDKIGDQLKSLSPTEIFGDKAKGIKDQLSKVQTELSALTQRYEIYAKKYQEVGGDLSAIKIG
jgi:archaellum component FlaC